MAISLALGSRALPLPDVIRALVSPDDSVASVIVWELRLPRALAALLVGSGLAVAGVLMQSLTRNPLAEPGLLGVNAGAALAVVVGAAVLGIGSLSGRLWLACLGAAGAALLVGWIGLGRHSPSTDPLAHLLLTGLALSACAGAVTGSITMFNSSAFDSHRFWVVGSLTERTYEQVGAVAPLIVLGLVLGMLVIKPLDALLMGEDAAAALGVPVGQVRLLTLLAITLLCGGATALAGPIGFVGLVVPHALRLLVGSSIKRVLPLSLLFGALLVLIADVIGRLVLAPAELEVGIVTALIGAPVLLILVLRRERPRSCPAARRLSRYSQQVGVLGSRQEGDRA
ncbi:iron ABC transporter permease [Rothia nasimurium]|uniref:Iron ABC transporter permease n=1 Tax=Rothia nasimurium TaxID=85336 RepID=A0A4Y9F5C5_9MICC|nr:iron ABC transporter permease [Rothia nasimurium]TFU23550.1 iron ABC transporter permease [Rothia nasimurium]